MSELTPDDILNFWFTSDLEVDYKQKWFPSSTVETMDLLIKDRFFDLLQKAERKELEDWKLKPKSFLALIIVLDQFTRHVYRHGDGIQKAANDEIALGYCEEILAKGWEKCFTVEETIFCIMPLRHSATIERLNRVLEITEKLNSKTSSRSDLLSKFKKATYRRLLDLEGKEVDTEDILEFHGFECDDPLMAKTKLYKTIDRFFHDRNVYNFKYMMISLSGGVDSMVLAKISQLLSKKYDFKIICIHIDYCNRPESGAEAAFVEQWSTSLGCQFRKSVIENITRGVTKRDDYEKLSREIRYDLYKEVLQEFGNDCPGVMVGHHKGDVQENVISNFMKGCSLLDLSGMGYEGIVNGVKIWRPMLDHDKDVVFDFAHKFGVPYFKDTTPKWSNRGKLRNHLLPLLQEIYGVGVKNNLSSMANDSEQLWELTSKTIFEPFWNSVVETPLGVYFDGNPFIQYPIYFWKEALKHICHSLLGVGMIGEGPIGVMMEKMRKGNVNGWVTMKKEYKTYLANTTLILFRPKFTNVESFAADLEINSRGETSVEPWTITITPAEHVTLQPASYHVTDIMSGCIKYQIPLSQTYALATSWRPKEYRQIEKKITDFFPIINCPKIKNPMEFVDVSIKYSRQ